MTSEQDLRQVSHLANEAAKAAARGADTSLALLLAEMHALCDVLPGALAGSARRAAPALAPDDADVEAAFDNMPV